MDREKITSHQLRLKTAHRIIFVMQWASLFETCPTLNVHQHFAEHRTGGRIARTEKVPRTPVRCKHVLTSYADMRRQYLCTSAQIMQRRFQHRACTCRSGTNSSWVFLSQYCERTNSFRR